MTCGPFEQYWSESGKPLGHATHGYDIGVEDAAVLKQAVDHFGRRAQLKKAAEELIELAVECVRAANGAAMAQEAQDELVELVRSKAQQSVASYDHLAECLAHERADVEIMMHQFDNWLLPSLRPAVEAKIKSQVERLAGRMQG